ncbi:TetR/AcrR family transcriptional regulator [Sneathiella chinensis]|uniref:TetR family transcriptional regulator n=1 Tax=Sneathiella chinensis TaxID=349750 RepID=A0ABQ5U8W9_9PROT|nr:TetR/AcrR family transcriptional regulator [Sneathiella chinensis]GLQ07630.1 TetR family transcriptional regulator [Sneathiella chinensis]
MSMKKGEQTRQRLVAAAAGLFQEKGYAATGLSDITRAGEVPKGSVYFHFPGGKEDIAVAAVEQGRDQILEGLRMVADSAGTLTARLDAILDHFAEMLAASGYAKGCPIGALAGELSPVSSKVQGACAGAYSAWQETLQGILAPDGSREMQARQGAELFLSAVEGALLLARTYQDRGPLDRLKGTLVPVIVNLMEGERS